MNDLILLNDFLGSICALKRNTSVYQLYTEISSRIVAMGFVLSSLKDNTKFSEDFGDLYLELDQYPVFGEDGNRLEREFGQKFYVNFCWDGLDVASQIVPESELTRV